MKHAIKRIHFIGIGGSGMSGIAEVLHTLGYAVSGSDIQTSHTLAHLQSVGIKTFVGHDASNLQDVDVVVTSTAVKADNPEVLAARARRIPVVPRAVMLAELMRFKQGIAIAGTHGKTTTTSLAASVLAQAGLEPTFVIGGRLNSAGANAQLGKGDYIVVEADESDASFLNLLPIMAVVTNIDADHMETYGHDFLKLKAAFVEFLHRMPFYGAAIVCIDDEAIREISTQVARPIITYGFDESAHFRATQVEDDHGRMRFTVLRKDGEHELAPMQVTLNLPGKHNVLNALSVIAMAYELEISDDAVLAALADFKGVGRRFQRYGEIACGTATGQYFTLVDDYGHHPVEMKATIAAARGAFPGRRLVLAFQPHRYTRTRDCFEDFVKVLGEADCVLLTEVYAAGEVPIAAADGRALTRAVRLQGKVEPIFVDDVTTLAQHILDITQPNDVVLCMGAGSIGQVATQIQQFAAHQSLPKTVATR